MKFYPIVAGIGIGFIVIGLILAFIVSMIPFVGPILAFLFTPLILLGVAALIIAGILYYVRG